MFSESSEHVGPRRSALCVVAYTGICRTLQAFSSFCAVERLSHVSPLLIEAGLSTAYTLGYSWIAGLNFS